MDEGRLDWIFGFFPPLKKFWLSRAGTLSGGQKQMLSFARAMIEPRRLLLIDEPTKGLAPAIIGALIDCLKEVKRRGATESARASSSVCTSYTACVRSSSAITVPA